MKRSDQRRAAVVALYQRDVTGRPLDQLLDKHATAFTRELAEGAAADQAELDGLIERHGESLDDGLERLRQAAVQASGDLEQMMAHILEHSRGPESVDDTAIAGVQWVTATDR